MNNITNSSAGTTQGFEAFTFANTTGARVPSDLVVLPAATALQFCDPVSGRIACSWLWSQVRNVSIEPLTDDPDDMEMISIFTQSGKLTLELNEAAPLATAIADARAAQLLSATATAIPDPQAQSGTFEHPRHSDPHDRDAAIKHLATVGRLFKLKQELVKQKLERQKQRQKEKEAIEAQEKVETERAERESRKATRGFLLTAQFVFLYLTVGCLYYSETEGWTFLECMYFLVVTIT